MWKLLFGGIMELGTTIVNRRAEKSQAKHERSVAKIKASADWEIEAVKAGQNGWKDEYLTVFITTPIGVLFLAALSGSEKIIERVQYSFVVMDTLPEWYVYLFSAVVLSGIGLKIWDKTVSK